MAVPFSDEDKAFIHTITENPAELTGWLAYADWLDERDDPRAEFIRLEVRRGELPADAPERPENEQQLRDLRKTLDPDWVAVFDRPPIENCDEAFKFQCPKQWVALTGTDDPKVRRCEGCRKLVYYCATIDEAHEHAQLGRCVAVSLAVLRSPGDLAEDALLDSVFGDDSIGCFTPDDRPEPPPRG